MKGIPVVSLSGSQPFPALQRVAGAISPSLGSGVLPSVDVSTTVQGSVAVLRAADWVAVVLAVLPAETDALLVSAARARAQFVLPDQVPLDGSDWATFHQQPGEVPPGLDVDTDLVDLTPGLRALVWLAAGTPSPTAVDALTCEAGRVIPEIRRHLPASTALAVACLADPVRELFERAARICLEYLAPGVGLAHLAGALLTAPDLWSAAPPDGPWPDPTPEVWEVLQGIGPGPGALATVRTRVGHRLAISRLAGVDAAPGLPEPAPEGVRSTGGVPMPIHAIAMGALPGVGLLHDAFAEPPPGTALELAAQLGRTDISVVVLAGAEPARRRTLAGLAGLSGGGRPAWLSGKHLVLVDVATLTSGSDAGLAEVLTHHGGQIVLAVTGTSGISRHTDLVRAARQARVPTIWLCLPHQVRAAEAALGDVPVVLVEDSPTTGLVPLSAQLAPIAAELASAHQVRLGPGVVAAAAAPGRSTSPEGDGDEPGIDDPVGLGRARLDFACSRAALRPDRKVEPQDVPADPRSGLRDGSAVAVPMPREALAAALADEIVGQDEPVQILVDRLAVAARGLGRPGPRANLLLAGPPGTGKTHTAGVIAKVYFGDPRALIRIDCGALYDRHAISSLLGSPPGYVGWDQHEQLLTSQIEAQRGRCVVLVDEVEKADRRVLDLFLEVLDTGRLTDLQRRAIDATGCIFVFTSNIGAEQFIGQPTGFSPTNHRQVETVVRAQIRRHLRPELLDRIDDIVVYRPLTQADLAELTHRHLAALITDLHREGYHLHVDPGTELMVANQACAIGARALRRHFESTVLRPLLELPPGRYRADTSTGILLWHSQDAPEQTI